MDGDTTPATLGGEWRWDVALSFASAQRSYVEQVAAELKARGLRVFYDADEETGLWGRHLAEELPAIYAEEAAAVVVFISADYATRDWTRLELRAALGRVVRERREYVLPVRFDDTTLPGVLSDLVTMDLRDRSPQEFAAKLATKLAEVTITGHSPASGEDREHARATWRPVSKIRDIQRGARRAILTAIAVFVIIFPILTQPEAQVAITSFTINSTGAPGPPGTYVQVFGSSSHIDKDLKIFAVARLPHEPGKWYVSDPAKVDNQGRWTATIMLGSADFTGARVEAIPMPAATFAPSER
jgi:hypothetical protein